MSTLMDNLILRAVALTSMVEAHKTQYHNYLKFSVNDMTQKF